MHVASRDAAPGAQRAQLRREFAHLYPGVIAGSRYVVHSIRPTRGRAPKSVAKVELLKLAPAELEPDGARRFEFQWCSRNQR